VEWDFIYANAMDAITAVRFGLLFCYRVDLVQVFIASLALIPICSN
jgi:hypothetical protein